MEETTSPQGGTESAPVPSGLGMNRVACGSDDKVVSVGSARRNTHTQERAGVLDARERTRTSPTCEVKTKKSTQGGAECAPQLDQLLQLWDQMSPMQRDAVVNLMKQFVVK